MVAFLAFSTDWTWEATLWCAAMLFYVASLTSIAKTEHGPVGLRYWPVVSLFVPAALALIRSFEIGVIVIAVAMILWSIYSCTFVYVRSTQWRRDRAFDRRNIAARRARARNA
ncbi:MAG: hypothetical protein R2845_06505 [Thermomicrobiales bacterium]